MATSPAELRELRAELQQARNPRERLNILEKIAASIDPTDEYLEAILDAIEELIEIQKDGLDGATPTPDVPETGSQPPETPGSPGGQPPTGGVPGNVAPLLEDVVQLLDLQTTGFVDTTNLGIGATGRALEDIEQGSTGVAVFDIGGGRWAAQVEAGQPVRQFDDVRVVDEANTVEPIPEETDAGGTRIAGAGPRTSSTAQAGPENAAKVNLGSMIKGFSVYYDVDSDADDVVIEVATDDDEDKWRPYERIQVPDDGEADLAKDRTTNYQWVRAYAGSEFNIDNVTVVELATKGVS